MSTSTQEVPIASFLKEVMRVAAQAFPEAHAYWYARFFRKEAEEEPFAAEAEKSGAEGKVNKDKTDV